jgi:hypothetical protein
MSRRGRHGNPGAPRPGHLPGTPAPERAPGFVDAPSVDARPIEERAVPPAQFAPTRPVSAPIRPEHGANGNGAHSEPHASAPAAAPMVTTDGPAHGFGPDGGRSTCTTAQLRRFIKSRPWVPMHELRRRFGIWGADDDVTPIRVGDQTLFIGLPDAEGRMVAELLSGGDVGYELSLDPNAPIVVGVYPMRPVPRS